MMESESKGMSRTSRAGADMRHLCSAVEHGIGSGTSAAGFRLIVVLRVGLLITPHLGNLSPLTLSLQEK
jgi:hypothetical protein